MAEMNARQRKHVYMHSTIFDTEGPAPRSVYAPSRQHELYSNFSDKLRANNTGQVPELEMPKPSDMKCMQNQGHNTVLPGTSPREVPAAGMRTSREGMQQYDDSAVPVVRSSGKDHATIPKEFWSTSTTLQWHDTRNEKCRGKNGQVERQGMGAQEMKRQELSSEVFGKVRITEASTTPLTARGQLMADSADYLRMDSTLHAPKQFVTPSGERRPEETASARARLHQNLANSVHNTMPVHEGAGQGPSQVPHEGDDPSNVGRRRQEKNFSDLFGAQMGERKEVRGKREEVIGTHSCSFLDSRAEIASRNKDHWKHNPHQSPGRRKDAQLESNLFDNESPQKPAMEPDVQKVHREERSCWESKDGMQATNETARRRRMKDHKSDFDDQDGRTHQVRKQESLASTQMLVGMGALPEPREAWAATTGPPPPKFGANLRGPSPVEREALLRSPKDTKLASLQSSIFS